MFLWKNVLRKLSNVMSTAQVFHNENKTWDAARSWSMWKRHQRTLKSYEQVPRVHKHLYATCSESTESAFLTNALNLNWKMGKGHVMFSIYHRSGPKLVFKNSATPSALMRLLLTFTVSTNSSLKNKTNFKGHISCLQESKTHIWIKGLKSPNNYSA